MKVGSHRPKYYGIKAGACVCGVALAALVRCGRLAGAQA